MTRVGVVGSHSLEMDPPHDRGFFNKSRDAINKCKSFPVVFLMEKTWNYPTLAIDASTFFHFLLPIWWKRQPSDSLLHSFTAPILFFLSFFISSSAFHRLPFASFCNRSLVLVVVLRCIYAVHAHIAVVRCIYTVDARIAEPAVWATTNSDQ